MAANSKVEDTGLKTIIERTAELFEAKEVLYAELATARTAARALVSMGVGNDEQRAWVAEYLPLKQRRVQPDTEAPAAA